MTAGAGCTSGEARGERNGGSHEREGVAPGGNREEAATRDSVVWLDSVSQRLVGIEVEAVGSAGSDAFVANGTITYNANRVSVVGPRSEGRIASVRADLGEQVRAGAVLAVIESPEVGQLRGELVRAQAMLDVTRQNYEREQR
ncbi:MAG TPA: efflux RND transporter periplasmic adaptor subunit, partial [Polyangiaceae bacterium]|nr:efflux RND transporter periplasmic adaptor subunit [Polyangiaceae bacterium]